MRLTKEKNSQRSLYLDTSKDTALKKGKKLFETKN